MNNNVNNRKNGEKKNNNKKFLIIYAVIAFLFLYSFFNSEGNVNDKRNFL